MRGSISDLWLPSPSGRGGGGEGAAKGRFSLLLFFLLLPLLACGSDESAAVLADSPPVERIVTVSTRLTTTREVVERISLPADLLPVKRAVLAAEVAGTVEKVHVDEGDAAAAGRILVEIDTRVLEQRLTEAEAVHRHREALFQRAEKLLARKSITEQQYLDAVTERDVATSQLENARLMLEKSRIAAPWRGTVAVRRVEVGDYVMPGQPVLELLDARRLKVRAPAPASDVPFLRRGLPAEIRLDVYPGEVFEGTVMKLAAELDASARTLDVEVEIPNADGRLRPGMYARLEMPRRTLEQAVLVPLSAVVELEDAKVVYVVEDERAVQRAVELGTVLDDEVVVAKGLSAGERLIVEGQRQVSPGQRVKLTGGA
ncbi:MAG: efflux RND transporter periplasmic adaptor subunit [bacterium]|nr:efflux RND transporter periplasmic adaptor subunit [bacterium]